MMGHLKHKVAKTARRAGFATGGFLCLCIGLGFLTLAGWIYLEAELGAQLASLILAGIYLGVGLLLFAFAGREHSHAHSNHDAKAHARNGAMPQPGDGPPLVQAFLYGLQAGASAEERRS